MPRQGPPEDFRPFAHSQPDSPLQRLKFQARLLADFQVRTVYAHVTEALSTASGKLLDVGCGDQPYRPLIEERGFEYTGCDIADAQKFGYQRPSVVPYDGKRLPFDDGSFDFVLCTEVLEHTEDPETLAREVHRVLKPGGKALVTVPWSARFHYAPWDFYRFTPTALERLFAHFASARVVARGTDLTSISAKVLVACLRASPQWLASRGVGQWLKDVAAALPLAPLAVPAVVMGHASLAAGLGSSDDPLGYSVFLQK